MGFKYSYNIAIAAREINAASYDASNRYNDGYISWGAKQDLYRLKWILDDAIKRCPEFGITETDWLKEQEKQRIIDILKTEIKK
jgi:hypothetical protein